MTLDQLETLVTVAEERGLRAASKKLHKTQPSLSVAIKNLEEELGISLLNRSGYRVELSEQGRALRPKIIEVLSKVEEIKMLSQEMQSGTEPFLNLAIDYLCPLDFLLKLLNKFKSTCKQTKIEMDFEILSGTEESLLNGNCDIGLTPFLSQHSHFEFKKVCDLKIIPVATKSLFATNKPSRESLAEIPQISVKSSSKKSSSTHFGLNQDSPQWTVSDHMIKKELILNGFGWGHLEERSISKELKSKKLMELKVKNVKRKVLPLYIVRSTKKSFGPVANDLWDFISLQFKKL